MLFLTCLYAAHGFFIAYQFIVIKVKFISNGKLPPTKALNPLSHWAVLSLIFLNYLLPTEWFLALFPLSGSRLGLGTVGLPPLPLYPCTLSCPPNSLSALRSLLGELPTSLCQAVPPCTTSLTPTLQ